MTDDKDDNRKDEQKHYGWQDGMPTKPDVDLLLKTWPDPKIGDQFEYETIANILGQPYESTRWKTVTNAWRNRMEEKGFILDCLTGKAFYVASVAQVTAKTWGKVKSAGKMLRKQRRQLSVMDPKTESERQLISHQGRLLHESERYLRKTRMNMLPKTEVKEAPKTLPPKQQTTEANGENRN